MAQPIIEEATPEEQAAAREAEVQAEAEAVAHVVEDDDTLNLPAPSAETLYHRRRAPGAQRELISRTVGFKQTMIPILLTMGVLLAGIAGWSFSLGEESPIASALWIPIALLVIGVIMLILGAVTMLQVKAQLERLSQA